MFIPQQTMLDEHTKFYFLIFQTLGGASNSCQAQTSLLTDKS